MFGIFTVRPANRPRGQCTKLPLNTPRRGNLRRKGPFELIDETLYQAQSMQVLCKFLTLILSI